MHPNLQHIQIRSRPVCFECMLFISSNVSSKGNLLKVSMIAWTIKSRTSASKQYPPQFYLIRQTMTKATLTNASSKLLHGATVPKSNIRGLSQNIPHDDRNSHQTYYRAFRLHSPLHLKVKRYCRG